MRPIALEEVLPLEPYRSVRRAYRNAVIAHKRQRRLSVGDKVTLVFEDRETLRFQIQEMLWIERISDERKVQDEIDVYNELMPGENELSATLFIEITELPNIRQELDRLIGLDERVALILGEDAEALEIPARFDPKQSDEERISAVQYIRFPLGAEGAARFVAPRVRARVRIDHSHYRHEVEIPELERRSLCETLSGEPASLLPEGAVSDADPKAPEALFESRNFRALRLPPPGAGVVVEPLEPVSFFEADPQLQAEALELVKRAAAWLLRDQQSCRVWAELGREGSILRWHIQAPGS